MLDLDNEPYSARGSLDARGAREALGRFDLSAWEVFFRETVQNSWDAKAESTIDFVVKATRLDERRRSVLHNEVFAQLPPTMMDFEQELRAHDVDLLIVADAHTKGLGGPTRAGVLTSSSEAVDFKEFVRNLGRDRSRSLGGGTYGFGKSVLYQASRVNTCLIYSQTWTTTGLEPRFIAVRLAERYEHDGREYTGRHWWGRSAHDGVVEPIIGAEAARLASELGINTLEENQTGTAIAVVAPRTSEGGIDVPLTEVVKILADAAMKWAWPHMLEGPDGPSIRFSFEAFGVPFAVGSPTAHPVFRHYAASYPAAIRGLESNLDRDEWPVSSRAVRLERPSRYLGQIAWRRVRMPDPVQPTDPVRHVALMRAPRLIVKYLEVQPDPDGLMVAGVFVADSSADEDFARSEPPAHDDWKPEVLSPEVRQTRANPVRVALRKIENFLRQEPAPGPQAAGSDSPGGVATLARDLGTMLAGSGPEIRPRRPRVGTGRSRGIQRVVVRPNPTLHYGMDGVLAEFFFDFRPFASAAADSVFSATPSVILDSGVIEKPDGLPVGAAQPKIIEWRTGGAKVADSASVPIDLFREGNGSVVVWQPPESSITVSVRISSAIGETS